RARHLRAQAASLPHPARRRPPHPPCPAHHAAPPRRLAVGRCDLACVQAPASIAGLRLNAASVLPADRTMLFRSRDRRCPKTVPSGVSQRRRTCPAPDQVSLQAGPRQLTPVIPPGSSPSELLTNRG